MGETIKLTADDGFTLSAYQARPEGRPKACVVVIQEIFGVNGHIRRDADKFARLGYMAVAPAVFDRVETGVDLGYDQAGMEKGRDLVAKLGLDNALRDIRATANYLLAFGPVGAVGYCWGGSAAWACATRLGIPAVGYYGGRTAQLMHERPQAPAMLHFGARDHLIGELVEDEHDREDIDAFTIETERRGSGHVADPQRHPLRLVALQLAAIDRGCRLVDPPQARPREAIGQVDAVATGPTSQVDQGLERAPGQELGGELVRELRGEIRAGHRVVAVIARDLAPVAPLARYQPIEAMQRLVVGVVGVHDLEQAAVPLGISRPVDARTALREDTDLEEVLADRAERMAVELGVGVEIESGRREHGVGEPDLLERRQTHDDQALPRRAAQPPRMRGQLERSAPPAHPHQFEDVADDHRCPESCPDVPL